jgi:hypothetical protein
VATPRAVPTAGVGPSALRNLDFDLLPPAPTPSRAPAPAPTRGGREPLRRETPPAGATAPLGGCWGAWVLPGAEARVGPDAGTTGWTRERGGGGRVLDRCPACGTLATRPPGR